MTVGDIVARLRVDTSQFTGALAKANAQLTTSAAQMQARATGLGMALTGVGGAMAMVAGMTLKGAAQMERYQAQFKVLYGSAETAKARLKELTDFAAKTPFDLPGVIEADRLMKAFNLDAAGGTKMLRLFGDAAAAMGVPMDVVVRNMAKLQAGMFDMAEMAPLGITRDKLRAFGVEFTKTGEAINRKDLFPAGIKILQQFSGTMAEMSKTAEGKLSNLRDAFFQTAAKIGENFLPALKAVLERITKVAEAIGKWANKNTEWTGGIGKAAIALAGFAGLMGPLIIGVNQLTLALGTAGLAGAFVSVAAKGTIAIGVIAGVGAAAASAYNLVQAWLQARERAAWETKAGTAARMTEAERNRARALLTTAQRGTYELTGWQKHRQTGIPGLKYEDIRWLETQGVRARGTFESAEKYAAYLGEWIGRIRAAEKMIAGYKVYKPAKITIPGIPGAGAGGGAGAAGTTSKAHKATLEEMLADERTYAQLLYDTGKAPIERLIALYERQIAMFKAGARERLEIEKELIAARKVLYEQAPYRRTAAPPGGEAALAPLGGAEELIGGGITPAGPQMAVPAESIAAIWARRTALLEATARLYLERFRKVFSREQMEELLQPWIEELQTLGPEGQLAAFSLEHSLEGVGEKIKRIFLDIGDLAKGIFDGLTRVMTDFFARVLRGTASLKDAWSGFRELTASVIANLIAAGMTDWIGRQTGLAVAAAQHGGIVTRPTLALIGEAGPEAIIPLRGGLAAAGAGGGEVHVHFHALDPPTFMSWAQRNKGAIADAVAGAAADGRPSTRPRYRE